MLARLAGFAFVTVLLTGCSGRSWSESKRLYKKMDFGSSVKQIGDPYENAGKLWWRLGVTANFTFDEVRFPTGFVLVPEAVPELPPTQDGNVWTFGARTALFDDGKQSCGISMTLNGRGRSTTPPKPSELGVGISCAKSLSGKG